MLTTFTASENPSILANDEIEACLVRAGLSHVQIAPFLEEEIRCYQACQGRSGIDTLPTQKAIVWVNFLHFPVRSIELRHQISRLLSMFPAQTHPIRRGCVLLEQARIAFQYGDSASSLALCKEAITCLTAKHYQSDQDMVFNHSPLIPFLSLIAFQEPCVVSQIAAAYTWMALILRDRMRTEEYTQVFLSYSL
jgi:hypothetical protein